MTFYAQLLGFIATALAAIFFFIPMLASAESIQLTWTAATGPVDSYVVEATVDGSQWAPVGSVSEPPFGADLIDGSTYSFRAYARTASGIPGPVSQSSTAIMGGDDRQPVSLSAPGPVTIILLPQPTP